MTLLIGIFEAFGNLYTQLIDIEYIYLKKIKFIYKSASEVLCVWHGIGLDIALSGVLARVESIVV